MLYILCTLVILFIPLQLHALPQYSFYTYDEAHVPDLGEFHGIMQDSRGMIWIWGSRGAAFYDGGRFRHLTQADGLPADYCYKVRENPDGTIYFATYGGVATFDVLADKLEIISLSVARGPARDVYFYKDVMFVAFDAGVYFIKENYWYPVYALIRGVTEQGSMINAICPGPAPNKVWLASEYAGVVELDLDKTLEMYTLSDPAMQKELELLGNQQFQEKYPGVLMENGDHFLFFDAKDIAVLLENRKMQSLQRVVVPKPEGWDRWPVYNVFETNDGNWYTFALGGLYIIEEGEAKFHDPSDGTDLKIISGAGLTPDGNMYVLSDKGVCVVHPDSVQHFSPETGLPGNTVQTFMQDRDGGFWFGQSAGEVSRLVTQAVHLFPGNEYALLNDVVRAAPRPDGGLLLGGPNGFSVYKDRDLTTALALSEGIRGFDFDKNGNLLIATDFSITLADFSQRAGKTLMHFSKPTEGSIFCKRDVVGNVWITIAGQLFCWNGKKLTDFKDYLLDVVYPVLLYTASDTTIYISNWNDIVRMRGEEKTIYHKIGIMREEASRFDFSEAFWAEENRRRVFPREQFSDNLAAFCAEEGPDGAIWFGTFNAGIIRVDGDSVNNWDSRHGLPGNRFMSVYKDYDGDLYFLGVDGVVQVDESGPHPLDLDLPERIQLDNMIKDREGRFYFATTMGLLVIDGDRQFILDRGFGLEESWVNFLTQTEDGEIVAVQPNGLYTFYPEDLFSSLQGDKNKPFVTSLIADGVHYPIGESIRLPVGVRDFTTQFTLPTYLNESRHLFSWRMEGLENEFTPWQSTRQAAFERVPPGRYVFHLKSMDGLGRKSEIAIPVEVIIPPSFYETLAFRIIMIMLVLAALAGLYSWRMHQEKVTQLRLEAMVKQRTTELEEALYRLEESKKWEIETERLRAVQKMAASVAHEFNNPLTVVQGVFQINEKKLRETTDQNTQQMLDMVPRHLQRMKDLVRKLTSITHLKEMGYTEDVSIIDIHASADPGKGNPENN